MGSRSRLVAGAALLLLTGCATTGVQELALDRAAWVREVRVRGLEPSEVVYPFDATPEMTQWAHTATERYTGRLERLKRLQQVLFDEHRFAFSYDEGASLTAEEAFASHRGNCLSFTSLFVALSRSIGLRTFLVAVERVLDVSKEESLVVVNHHVVAGYLEAGNMHLFDFFLSSEAPYVRQVIVDDVGASAMFAVNRASALLQRGDVTGAVQGFEQATQLAPDLPAAWINLGVARRRSGDLDGALAAYERALQADPGNPSALTNLAYLYTQTGHPDQAHAALQAAAEGRSSPFSLIALADAEMARGHLDAARRHLLRARRTYRATAETYDALARWATRAGQPRRAQRYAARASQLRRRAVQQGP